MNSLITHPILGTGKVVKHIPPNKMDVEFGEEIKRLVCGKISSAASIEQNSQPTIAIEYSPYGIFQTNDIINHRRFGVGKVVSYIHPTEIDVKFPIGIKRLKCGRHPRRFIKNYPSLYARQGNDIASEFVCEEKFAIQESNKDITIEDEIVIERIDKKNVALEIIYNNNVKKIQHERSQLDYSPDRIFPLESIIKHNTFGIGEVIKYASQNEIDVKFSNEIIRLSCGRLPESLLKKYTSHDSSQKSDIVIESFLSTESHNVMDEYLETIVRHSNHHSYSKIDDTHNDINNAVSLVGLNPNDIQSKKVLHQLLDEWDYNIGASAQIAYNKPGIERLQLLRQIAGLLKDGMGFSQLYNMLETRRGQSERGKACSADKTLQPWTGLTSSVRLRSFIEEHEDFLCGHVVDGKWKSYSPPRDPDVLCHAVGKAPHETPLLNDSFAEKLMQVLSMRFPNGYRLDSPIELARFRSVAAEFLDKEITLPDEDLKKCISTCGIIYKGKVYVVSAQAEERVKELAEEYFADGARAIFFAEFYAKNESWLFDVSIVSEEMLIDILRRLFPKLLFTQTYFGYTDGSVFTVLESEILRIWGDDTLLTYEQISERLQYIPMERIRSVLGQNRDFIWHSVGTFSHISRIDITDEEREAICKAATDGCNAHGYVSLAGLPTEEIEARNDGLSITAIHSAVFLLCLSDKFDGNGKIVTRKGDVLNALSIMKNYCRTIDKCSLGDLLNYEKALTGDANRWIPMEAGNTILVRIDRDRYVSDKYVKFDPDVVDAAIELFINGDYLPLKSFTTFGAFPDCGQTWNLFLLESYCRRFSKKFRFDNLSVNSQNIGAVIRKSCDLKYIEIMTDAVVAFGVPMTDSAVGEFLLNSGYIGRKRATIIGEVIDKAKVSQKRVD